LYYADTRYGDMMKTEKSMGFILIGTSPAREEEVYNKVLKLSEVVEAHPLFGEFDMIAKMEAKDFKELDLKAEKIRKIDGVVNIKTLTGLRW